MSLGSIYHSIVNKAMVHLFGQAKEGKLSFDALDEYSVWQKTCKELVDTEYENSPFLNLINTYVSNRLQKKFGII